jgi:hypothetical protein
VNRNDQETNDNLDRILTELLEQSVRVEPIPGIEDRVLMAVQTRLSRRRNRRWLGALAASILVVVSLALLWRAQLPETNPSIPVASVEPSTLQTESSSPTLEPTVERDRFETIAQQQEAPKPISKPETPKAAVLAKAVPEPAQLVHPETTASAPARSPEHAWALALAQTPQNEQGLIGLFSLGPVGLSEVSVLALDIHVEDPTPKAQDRGEIG